MCYVLLSVMSYVLCVIKFSVLLSVMCNLCYVVCIIMCYVLIIVLQGTHPCLQGNTKAMATVTAIIDGTGSMGEDIT